MKFNISEILKSTVLLEGRLEDVKAKYPGKEQLVDSLSQDDPSGNNKYLGWMMKHVNGDGADERIPMADLVVDTVNKFHVSGDRLKKQGLSNDINTYKSVNQLIDTLETLSRRDAPSKRELKGTGELVYDGPKVYVIAPRNYEGSCKWGSGAKWCIAQNSTDHHWNNYIKSNLFYFAISKVLPSSDNNYKIAIQKNIGNNKNTYWDVPDRSSQTPQNPDIDQEVLDVVDKHAVEAKKHILKRLTEDMLDGVKSTLTSDNVNKVFDIVTDGQLFKILSNNLTLLSGKFDRVVDRFGTDNTIKLLKSDYSMLIKVLSDDIILKWLDDNTDRDMKLDLADKLKQHMSNVTPSVRAILGKWGMTDEDWEKYNSQSQYVFLGDKETGQPMEGVYKVDKFDTSSYDVISQLKLRLKYKDYSLYGAVTGKGELDDYLDGETVPEEVMRNIKTQKIA